MILVIHNILAIIFGILGVLYIKGMYDGFERLEKERDEALKNLFGDPEAEAEAEARKAKELEQEQKRKKALEIFDFSNAKRIVVTEDSPKTIERTKKREITYRESDSSFYTLHRPEYL